MANLFASPGRLAHRIAQQENQLDDAAETAEHSRHIHALLEEVKEALAYADPHVKTWQETLDPVQEVIVRYEEGRSRYAIYSSESGGTLVKVQSITGVTFTIQLTAPGWRALDLPPGAKLYSGDANRHTVMVRASNLFQSNDQGQALNTAPVQVVNAVAATTTFTGPDQTNSVWRGVKVYIITTAIGTGSITVSIQGKDAFGNYATLLASAAIVTNTTTILTLYPGIAVVANASASDVLPNTWRIVVTANNANPATYQVSQAMLA